MLGLVLFRISIKDHRVPCYETRSSSDGAVLNRNLMLHCTRALQLSQFQWNAPEPSRFDLLSPCQGGGATGGGMDVWTRLASTPLKGKCGKCHGVRRRTASQQVHSRVFYQATFKAHSLPSADHLFPREGIFISALPKPVVVVHLLDETNAIQTDKALNANWYQILLRSLKNVDQMEEFLIKHVLALCVHICSKCVNDRSRSSAEDLGVLQPRLV